MNCNNCGVALAKDNSKFCISCGSPLKATEQASSSTSSSLPEPTQAPLVENPLPNQPQVSQPSRGRVLVYNQSTGNGVISSGGKKFEFNITSWTSDNPPNVGMSIEINHAADIITFAPLDDVAAAKEKLNEFSTKVSTHGTEFAKQWAHQIGKPILIGYGIFIIGMFFLPFTNVMFAKPSLYELFKATDYTIFAWLAVGSIALPQLWKDQKSYWAYAIPAILIGLALIKALSTAYNAASAVSQFSAFFGKKTISETSLIFDALKNVHLEIGFWVVFISAAWLAYSGFNKTRKPC